MLTTSVTVTGTADAADKRAALLVIAEENERRAAADPPEAALPTGTNEEIRTSYETYLGQVCAAAHASYVERAKVADPELTQEERESVKSAVLDATQRGVSAAAIAAAIAAI